MAVDVTELRERKFLGMKRGKGTANFTIPVSLQTL